MTETSRRAQPHRQKQTLLQLRRPRSDVPAARRQRRQSSDLPLLMERSTCNLLLEKHLRVCQETDGNEINKFTRRKRDDICQGRKAWPRRERTRKAKKEGGRRWGTGANGEYPIPCIIVQNRDSSIQGRKCDRGCGLPRRVFTAALHALFSSSFTQTREADQISS